MTCLIDQKDLTLIWMTLNYLGLVLRRRERGVAEAARRRVTAALTGEGEELGEATSTSESEESVLLVEVSGEEGAAGEASFS